MNCPNCDSENVCCEFVHLLNGSGKWKCHECKFSWTDKDEGKSKVKQLLAKVDFITDKYTFRDKDIELYDGDFYLYKDDDEIYVERDGGYYIIELFIPINTSTEKVGEIRQKMEKALLEHFNNKIEKIKLMVDLIKGE